jgi:hypothetical protein
MLQDTKGPEVGTIQRFSVPLDEYLKIEVMVIDVSFSLL